MKKPNWPLRPNETQIIYMRWESRLWLELLTFQKAGALCLDVLH